MAVMTDKEFQMNLIKELKKLNTNLTEMNKYLGKSMEMAEKSMEDLQSGKLFEDDEEKESKKPAPKMTMEELEKACE